MEGVCGYSSWRWIFILEGIVTVVVAIIAKFLIADWPETARFLNERERSILLARLQSDTQVYRMDRLDRTAIRRILSDKKIYLGYVTLKVAMKDDLFMSNL
jgi:sugar phosphate permease